MLFVQIRDYYLFANYTWQDQLSYTWQQLKDNFIWRDLLYKPEVDNLTYVLSNSMNILDIVNDQSTCDLTVFDDNNIMKLKKGDPIRVFDYDGNLLFGGFINNVVKKHVGSYPSIKMSYQINAIDNHYVVNKRKIIKAFVNQTIDEAATWILENILEGEGIVLGNIVASTKIITKSYNYVSLREVLDELAVYAGYIWFISSDKKFYFIPISTYAAPFDISLDENCKCDYIKDDSFLVNDDNPEYRNTEYLIGSTNKTSLQTRTFKGDGETQTWTLQFNLAEIPIVKVNNVIKTVGLNTVNVGFDFYYAKGEPTITQDSEATKLTSSDILTVQFYGSYPIVVKTTNFVEISSKATLEKTSGIVEDVITDIAYENLVDSLERANLSISTYGIDAKTITYITFQDGLEAGQLQNIYSEFYELDHQCLISQVQKIEIENMIEYQITANVGPVADYWVKKMMAISQAKEKSLLDTVEVANVLLILLEYSKTWDENEHPNIFRFIYPSDDIYPNSIDFPCFDLEDTCKYIQINVPGNYRTYMVNQIITDTQIITTFIVPSTDCNDSFTQIKLFGGNLATETLNSGILLSTHNIIYTKNSLESLQIVVTYNRWDASTITEETLIYKLELDLLEYSDSYIGE